VSQCVRIMGPMVLLATPLALGCAMPQEGRLYQLDSGLVSRFRIVNTWSPSSEVEAELTDGSSCRGRVARTGPGAPILDPATAVPETDRGLAILVCRSSTVLKCHLLHHIDGNYSFGECVDQRGVKYAVLF
jgi:hypothetical protein